MKIPINSLTAMVTLAVFVTTSAAFAQDVAGRWKTIDDETGNPRSIVEIFEKDGKMYGKVVKLFRGPEEDPDPICDQCDEEDDRYRRKVIGMEIIRGMAKDEGGVLAGGQILDPKNGKVYNCRMWLEGSDLKVRGYWGPFYRTQTWHRSQ